ncbi:MAG TPA: M3 family metallopeptidase, partial [Chitinophagaceae bacterium]|nr:M3 family metallopeptidase [Chitinophagaceae bacterium]
MEHISFAARPLVRAFALASAVAAASAGFAQQANPLITTFNERINFKAVTSAHVRAATDVVIRRAKGELEKVYAIPADKRTFDNTVRALDDIGNRLSRTSSPVSVLYNASPDSAIRAEAQKALEAYSKFNNGLEVEERMYRAYKDYSLTPEGKGLTGGRKKMVQEALESFERNGFKLTAEKRRELQAINDRITDLGLSFTRNIATYKDQLLIDEAGVKGLPADYLKSKGKEGDKYVITIDGPSYTDFMRFAHSDTLRKELFIKYNNRAADKNLDLLTQLLIQRKKKAELLGFSTFAAYQTSDRMSKTPEAVWQFENNLLAQVKEKTANDLHELLEEKRKHLNDTMA